MEHIPPSPRFLKALLRVFFKLLYHQFSWAYDIVAVAVSLGRWKSWVLSTLPYLIGPRVLEIGHGTGDLQASLAQRGVQAIGLDESKQMGLLAFKRILGVKKIPRLVNGYAQKLPFPPDTFDQVVATFPTEYIYRIDTLKEIHRVLTPQGSLIVLPLAWLSGRGPLDRLAAWLFRYTGQAPEWNPQMDEPFLRAGFIIRIRKLDFNTSSLLLITCFKPTSMDPPSLKYISEF